MAKDKPMPVTAAAEWMGVAASKVREHPSYDAEADTVLVPSSLAQRYEAAKALTELGQSLSAVFVVPTVRVVNKLALRLSRR